MRFRKFRTDPTFDEFVWLAPMHSIGALALLVALGSSGYALVAGEAATVAIRGASAGFLLVPMLGLAFAAMNMVAAYLPSVVVWHLTVRLTVGHLGRRGAVRAAATATAVTASLILAWWVSFLLQQEGGRNTYLKVAAVIMVVSIIASVWTADRIERTRRR